MARKVFFSFHFKRDVWRAGQVRNSDLLADEDEYGVIDAAEWEKIEREGDAAIERWINDQLKNTSVTAVLIGAETAERDWIDYEIRRSWERGNALLGIRIHNVKNQDSQTDMPGSNPFDNISFTDGTRLSSVCKTYDWVSDNGRENLGKWVEEAFQERTKYGADKKIADSKNDKRNADEALKSLGSFAPRAAIVRESGEQFLSDLNITEAIAHTLIIDATVKQDGYRPFNLRGSTSPLKKKRKLEFFIQQTSAAVPYDVKWKVKNIGTEASSASDLRGEITDDLGYYKKNENTKYTGEHYVECLPDPKRGVRREKSARRSHN